MLQERLPNVLLSSVIDFHEILARLSVSWDSLLVRNHLATVWFGRCSALKGRSNIPTINKSIPFPQIEPRFNKNLTILHRENANLRFYPCFLSKKLYDRPLFYEIFPIRETVAKGRDNDSNSF